MLAIPTRVTRAFVQDVVFDGAELMWAAVVGFLAGLANWRLSATVAVFALLFAGLTVARRATPSSGRAPADLRMGEPYPQRAAGSRAGGRGAQQSGEIAEQLFVSRRTVATHLEHVFQKTGHANRVELAADATRRSISG